MTQNDQSLLWTWDPTHITVEYYSFGRVNTLQKSRDQN